MRIHQYNCRLRDGGKLLCTTEDYDTAAGALDDARKKLTEYPTTDAVYLHSIKIESFRIVPMLGGAGPELEQV